MKGGFTVTHGRAEDQLDLDAYFQRIGYDGERTSTLTTLQAIHLRHPNVTDDRIVGVRRDLVQGVLGG